MTAPLISLRGVQKYYGDYHALRGIDLDIRQGEFFSLLGPSGCGKTTLLRAIAGFEAPTAGTLTIDGRDMRGVPANERPTNMVFQSYAIFPHLSVAENVAFGLRREGGTRDEKARRVSDALVTASHLGDHFGDGPIVVGPVVPHLYAAGRSARAALSGHTAAHAWPKAPRPVSSDDLLAERALLGDLPARASLVSRVYAPLSASGGGNLLETAAAYLDGGLGLEGTARTLFVHPNTVRYRLSRVAELTGYVPTDGRGSFVLRVALTLGRLADTP